MDLSDIANLNGTIPSNNNPAILASIVIVIEGGRTMQSLCGDDRFSSPYGGEVMGATYVGILGLLGAILVKHPLPVVAAVGVIVFFSGLYHYEENRATR